MKTWLKHRLVRSLVCGLCALASLLGGESPAFAAAARKAAAKVPPACDWARPGHMPFMGDVVGAVDHYTDIPAPVRAKLKERMAQRRYDEIVSIKRDSISGNATYASSIRQMHFGETGMCSNVTRKTWTPQMEERGLVYCESGECILVPTVCRNVSRISRLSEAPVGGAVAGAPGGELLYDAPAAGGLPAAPPSALADPAAVPGATPPFIDEALPPTGAGPGFPFPPFYGIPYAIPGGLIPVGVPIEVPVVVPAVPEPQSLLLMLAGLAGLVAIGRRQRRASASSGAR